jgi:hypothetical protein
VVLHQRCRLNWLHLVHERLLRVPVSLRVLWRLEHGCLWGRCDECRLRGRGVRRPPAAARRSAAAAVGAAARTRSGEELVWEPMGKLESSYHKEQSERGCT